MALSHVGLGLTCQCSIGIGGDICNGNKTRSLEVLGNN